MFVFMYMFQGVVRFYGGCRESRVGVGLIFGLGGGARCFSFCVCFRVY